MILILNDRERTEITITPEQQVDIEHKIEQDYKWIKIAGFTLRPSGILMIKPGGSAQPEMFNDRQIPRPLESEIKGSLKDKLQKENPGTFKRLYG